MDQNRIKELNAIGSVEIAIDEKKERATESGGQSAKFVKDEEDKKYHGIATGFMINECLMVTNHHAAYLNSNQETVEGQSITVTQRDKGVDGRYGLTKTSGTVVESGNYRGETDNALNDFVFIKLEKPRRDKEGIIAPCYATLDQAMILSSDAAIGSASHYSDLQPRDKDKKPTGEIILWGQQKCTIYGDADSDLKAIKGLWKTDCPTIAGTSGSPIFTKLKGKLCALGFIKGTTVPDKDHTKRVGDDEYNTMIPFSKAISKERLAEIIKKNPCTEPVKLKFI